MRLKALTYRLTSLPTLHQAMPVALTAGLFAGSCAYIFFAPPTYVSTAVVNFDETASNPKNDAEAVDATVLAESILRPQVKASEMAWSDGPDNGPRPWRGKTQVVLSRVSESKVRLTLRGNEPRRTEAASQALLNRLTGWSPLPECPNCKESVGQRRAEGTAEGRSSREIDMLRVTVRLLDAKIAAANIASRRVGGRDRNVELKRTIESQREIVSRRLAEELAEAAAGKPGNQLKARLVSKSQASRGQQAAATRRHSADAVANGSKLIQVTPTESRQSSTADSDHAARETFHLVSQDSGTASLRERAVENLSISGLVSVLVGCLYVAAVLWWFRPLRDLQGLRRIVPSEVRIFSSAGKDLR